MGRERRGRRGGLTRRGLGYGGGGVAERGFVFAVVVLGRRSGWKGLASGGVKTHVGEAEVRKRGKGGNGWNRRAGAGASASAGADAVGGARGREGSEVVNIVIAARVGLGGLRGSVLGFNLWGGFWSEANARVDGDVEWIGVDLRGLRE